MAEDNISSSSAPDDHGLSASHADGGLATSLSIEHDLAQRQVPHEDSGGGSGSVLSGGGNQGWLPEIAAIAWRRILGILGDINDIKQPETHLTYMNNLAHLLSHLFKIRDNQGVSVDGTPSPSLYPPFIPPTECVLPWLFEAFDLPEHFAGSHRLALEMICKIFIRRDDRDWAEDYLLAFYSTLHQALVCSDIRLTSTAVMGCSPMVFALPESLPGSWILIQDFVTGARRIIESPNVTLPAKTKAVQILGTLVCLASQVESDEGRISILTSDSDENVSTSLSHDSLCMEIMQGLISCTSLEYPVSLRCTALQCLAQLFFRALSKAPATPSDDYTTFYSSILHTILYQLTPSDPQVSLTVLEALMPLLDISDAMARKFSTIPCRLLEMLGSTLAETLSVLKPTAGPLETSRPLQIELAASLLQSMVEWITRLPPNFLSQTGREDARAQTVLGLVIDACISCIRECRTTSDTELQSVVSSAAQLLLCHVFVRVAQWPLYLESATPATHALCAFQQDLNILSVEPQQNGHISLNHRGLTGRLPWQLELERTASIPLANQERPNQDMLTSTSCKAMVDIDVPKNDWLAGLVYSVLQTSAEVAPAMEQTICFPNQRDMENHIAAEHQQMQSDKEIPLQPYWEGFGPQEPLTTPSIADPARLATFQLNFTNLSRVIDVGQDKSDRLSVIQYSEQLQRELKHLDSASLPRETHKIAVVYVADGQEDKQSILSNQHGSELFEQFLLGLGWKVDLGTHSRYMGGLTATAGEKSLFYGSSLVDVMFHVSTMLSAADPMKRLRHIGNDEVMLVWSEHSRDYRRDIIATDFCDVIIAIYPLANRLFRVQIDKKDDIREDFGPLFNGALVDWSSLVPLVRTAAICASRAKRRTILGYANFWQARASRLPISRQGGDSRSVYATYIEKGHNPQGPHNVSGASDPLFLPTSPSKRPLGGSSTSLGAASTGSAGKSSLLRHVRSVQEESMV